MIRQQIENYCYLNRMTDTQILNKYWYTVKKVRQRDWLFDKDWVALVRLIWLDIPNLAQSIHNAIEQEERNKISFYQ